MNFAASGRWDDRNDLGWKERMDEYDDLADPDMGM